MGSEEQQHQHLWGGTVPHHSSFTNLLLPRLLPLLLGDKRRKDWKHIGILSSHSLRTDYLKVHVQDGSRVPHCRAGEEGTGVCRDSLFP